MSHAEGGRWCRGPFAKHRQDRLARISGVEQRDERSSEPAAGNSLAHWWTLEADAGLIVAWVLFYGRQNMLPAKSCLSHTMARGIDSHHHLTALGNVMAPPPCARSGFRIHKFHSTPSYSSTIFTGGKNSETGRSGT